VIVVRLIGGLGNQMFQYAVGRALAHRRGTVLKLDLSAFEKPVGAGIPRPCGLGAFELAAGAAARADVRRLKYGGRVRAALGLRAHTYLRERAANVYDPRVEKCGADAYLRGYWQTERYFADCRELLLRDFALRAGEPEPELSRRMHESDSVGLHVRRGDYVANARTNARHGTCEPGYYAQAIALLAPRLRRPEFFVFSDDLAWARANLDLPTPARFVSRPGLADAAELVLMSRCRHQIVANSSFSWWAAWLNANPDKAIVAPRRWLRREEDESPDLVPSTWLRV